MSLCETRYDEFQVPRDSTVDTPILQYRRTTKKGRGCHDCLRKQMNGPLTHDHLMVHLSTISFLQWCLMKNGVPSIWHLLQVPNNGVYFSYNIAICSYSWLYHDISDVAFFMWCHSNLAHYAGETKLCQASLEGCPWWGLPHHLGGRWWWQAWRVRDWAMILRLHDVCKRLEPWGGVSSHQMATCVKIHETIWSMFWIALVFTPK